VSRWTELTRFLGSRRKTSLIPAAAGMVACAALIVPIKVPKELSARTGLELSGVVWSPVLSRYVLVSDDVHDDSEAKHAPVLYALTEGGQLEAAPIRIEGLKELNDPESITAGPDGTLFVCTSHSANKKGHLPESRRRLLHLSIGQDRKAKVIGQVDLSLAKTQDGKPPWGPGVLDIEGLAFRDGALYFGLKSPLGSDGSASILRLPDAVSVLQQGTVPSGALALWATLKLCVPRDGASVCEGIADLAFLPDGNLLLAANSPKGMPSDGGGSLWKAAGPGATPTLIKRFEGLKPEGVALSPDRSSAIVVFDTDGREPLWIRWPLAS
jgi:hypothetical protein